MNKNDIRTCDEWINEELMKECYHDISPDRAASMAWKACRHEALKILIENNVSEDIKNQIRKL